jgi:hypothetical protein
VVTPDSTRSLPSPSLLRNTLECFLISNTRLSRSLATYSTVFFYQKTSHIEVLQPHNKLWFGLFPVRSSLTKGISFDFFSTGYLDISVPQVISLSLKARSPPYFYGRDCSIRTPPDHSFVTAPRRLSRSCTSFFVQTSQGIPYLRYITLILRFNFGMK